MKSIFLKLYFAEFGQVRLMLFQLRLIIIFLLLLLLSLLLLRSNPKKQHSKVIYRRVVRRGGKTGNHGKLGVEKVVGFSSASVFPERKREAVTQGETIEPKAQTTRPRTTQGPGIVKGWGNKRTESAFHIHSRKTRITRARAP